MRRKTNEVDVTVQLGEKGEVNTGDKVLDHLLVTLLFYADIEADISASGDLPHHLWEDTGITLGKALKSRINGKNIVRFGTGVVPMDDALVLASVDISRSYLSVDLRPKEDESGFDLSLYKEFLHGLVRELGVTIHLLQLKGANAHHLLEAGFKALGSAFCQALSSAGELRSTKGIL